MVEPWLIRPVYDIYLRLESEAGAGGGVGEGRWKLFGSEIQPGFRENESVIRERGREHEIKEERTGQGLDFKRNGK